MRTEMELFRLSLWMYHYEQALARFKSYVGKCTDTKLSDAFWQGAEEEGLLFNKNECFVYPVVRRTTGHHAFLDRIDMECVPYEKQQDGSGGTGVSAATDAA